MFEENKHNTYDCGIGESASHNIIVKNWTLSYRFQSDSRY